MTETVNEMHTLVNIYILLKVICNDFLVVKVNCSWTVFNIIKSI